MKILKLFPDQEELMSDLRAAMKRNKAVLLQAETGSGKTAIATRMLSNAVKKGKRAIFTVPRRDLLKQTSETLDSYGIHHSFIAAGRDYNPFANVYIGMIDTMARRINKLPKNIDLVIVDETHFGADALGRVINNYKDQGSWIIGLSATPCKMSGQGLGIWYDEMVKGKSMRWLIDNKRLSDYRYFYGRTRLDLSGLKVTAGDYNKGEVAEFMEGKSVIIGDCVSDYIERGMGRLWIVRCTSIKHSQITAEAFRNAGVPAVHVDGTTPDDIKHQIFMAYARREILVLTFADLLNFGFDLSQTTGMDVCIEGESDLKPSLSLAAQMQFWGRVLRYKDFPAIINDHVNNYKQKGFGLPCSERAWTLDSRSKKERTEATPPTKQCPNCFFVHPPAPKCPECNHVYEIKSREVDEVDGELLEMNISEFNKPKPDGLDSILPPLNDEATLEGLIKQASKIGRKNPVKWAAKELAKRMAGV